jgi:hypothetical protein
MLTDVLGLVGGLFNSTFGITDAAAVTVAGVLSALAAQPNPSPEQSAAMLRLIETLLDMMDTVSDGLAQDLIGAAASVAAGGRASQSIIMYRSHPVSVCMILPSGTSMIVIACGCPLARAGAGSPGLMTQFLQSLASHATKTMLPGSPPRTFVSPVAGTSLVLPRPMLVKERPDRVLRATFMRTHQCTASHV